MDHDGARDGDTRGMRGGGRWRWLDQIRRVGRDECAERHGRRELPAVGHVDREYPVVSPLLCSPESQMVVAAGSMERSCMAKKGYQQKIEQSASK